MAGHLSKPIPGTGKTNMLTDGDPDQFSNSSYDMLMIITKANPATQSIDLSRRCRIMFTDHSPGRFLKRNPCRVLGTTYTRRHSFRGGCCGIGHKLILRGFGNQTSDQAFNHHPDTVSGGFIISSQRQDHAQVAPDVRGHTKRNNEHLGNGKKKRVL